MRRQKNTRKRPKGARTAPRWRTYAELESAAQRGDQAARKELDSAERVKEFFLKADYATLDMSKDAKRLIAARRAADPEAEWPKIIGDLPLPEINDMLAAMKGKPGHPATKADVFRKARQLKLEGLQYPEIARLLTPAAYFKNPRNAGEAIRQGITRLKSPAKPTPST